MNDLSLVLTRGLPGSGKSTGARIAVKHAINTVRVNRDDLRDMLFGTRLLTNEQENMVSVAEKSQVEALLKAGISVVVDAMHLRNKYVREWAKVAAKYNADLILFDSFLDTDLEECIRRDAQRSEKERVGEDVIRSLHKRFFPIPPVKLDDIEPLKGKPYYPKPGTPRAYMVDIDGTCTTGPCDRSPYEWAKVGQDKPNFAVMDTVFSLYRQGCKIIFCSGRDAVCRPETMAWLQMYFGRGMMDSCPLLMRQEGDMRKDSVVKMELFDKYIRNEYTVVGVFDDRPQVIRMWKSLGLQVFDVAQSEEF